MKNVYSQSTGTSVVVLVLMAASLFADGSACVAAGGIGALSSQAAEPGEYFLPPEGRIMEMPSDPPPTWRELERREAARNTLKQKWGHIKRFSREEFINWITSQRTVMGAAIFSEVEIEGNVLRLWSARNSVIEANLQWFADLADAFMVWCQCDAMTTVGVDSRYLSLGRRVYYTIKLNPQTGRSAIDR